MEALPREVLDRFVAIVGAANVLTDADVRAGYERDWTGRFVGSTPAVVRPGSPEEVVAVVALCNRERIALVPQGGNTGLVGGSVPLAGELVLSLSRLRRLDPVDEFAAQVTVGAGVTIAELSSHAARSGLSYAVDLASRDTATVGGTIATNAGGLHFLRYGGTRQQVLGVEAVLSDGRIVRHLQGLPKDNTGYDLPSLLCGSEGTLAIVTAARVRLQPKYAHRVVAVLAFDTVAAIVEAVSWWRRELDCLDAAELFLLSGLQLVCETAGMAPPFASPSPAYLLIEASAGTDVTDRVASVVQSTSGVVDVAVAPDEQRAAALWAYREEHTVAINTLGSPHKLDVTLPFQHLAQFVEDVPRVIADVAPSASTWLFGHVGDGNIHVNVTGLDRDGVESVGDPVDRVVLELVAELGGSISAEHGIGTLKRPWLHLSRSEAELDTFRAIKHALDPEHILNPNVLLP